MKRRSFVKASLLTTAIGAIIPQAGMASKNKNNLDFYELRVYTLKNEAQQTLVEDFYKNAAIPAMNRISANPIGVFKELQPNGQTKIYVLIPHKSPEDFTLMDNKLVEDKAYQQQGSDYLNAPATAPAYERIESSFLKAFTHFPKIDVPENKPRIFELRRYEHATENAGKKKLEMFNDAGEIDIFKRLGFKPVFFGETLIGPMRPNLIYMVTFDDMESHDNHWKSFVADAEWKKISVIPDYADAKLVSHITSTLLAPLAFSQI